MRSTIHRRHSGRVGTTVKGDSTGRSGVLRVIWTCDVARPPRLPCRAPRAPQPDHQCADRGQGCRSRVRRSNQAEADKRRCDRRTVQRRQPSLAPRTTAAAGFAAAFALISRQKPRCRCGDHARRLSATRRSSYGCQLPVMWPIRSPGFRDISHVDFARFHVIFTDEPLVPRVVWLFSFMLGFNCAIATAPGDEDRKSAVLSRRLDRGA
jgi:hypothetical protein